MPSQENCAHTLVQNNLFQEIKKGYQAHRYFCEGDCWVTHFTLNEPAGEQFNFSVALIELHGRYPRGGLLARNFRRTELLYVLDGTINIQQGGQLLRLTRGQSIVIDEQTPYCGFGAGVGLVLVNDRSFGKTLLIAEGERRLPNPGFLASRHSVVETSPNT